MLPFLESLLPRFRALAMVLHRDDPQKLWRDLIDHGMVESLKLYPVCVPSCGGAQLREVQQQLDDSLDLFGEGVTQAG